MVKGQTREVVIPELEKYRGFKTWNNDSGWLDGVLSTYYIDPLVPIAGLVDMFKEKGYVRPSDGKPIDAVSLRNRATRLGLKRG